MKSEHSSFCCSGGPKTTFQQLFQIITVTSRKKADIGNFFQCCGIFDHLDQDNEAAFWSQILQDPLSRFFLCVGVLRV